MAESGIRPLGEGFETRRLLLGIGADNCGQACEQKCTAVNCMGVEARYPQIRHYFIGEKSVGCMYVESTFSTSLLACSDFSTS